MAEDKAKNDPDESNRPLFWDIVVLLTPYLPEETISSIFNESLEMTKADNATIQKKAWRLMEQIASNQNEVCSRIIDQNIKLIVEQMMVTLSTCAASARKPRLQLLEIILEKIENVEFLKRIIPELVICTKDNNTMSRTLAFRILSSICQKFLDKGEEIDSEPVLAFIQILLQDWSKNDHVGASILIHFGGHVNFVPKINFDPFHFPFLAECIKVDFAGKTTWINLFRSKIG